MKPIRPEISLVIPCLNEEMNIPNVASTLNQLNATFGDRYNFHFLFVDDGSTDNTFAILQKLFETKPQYQILRHPENIGITAAVMTGLRHAKTEIACVIDCDLSYKVEQLIEMIPLLTDGVAAVTASPYHTQGRVINVPPWRLFLSKTASAMYRLILQNNVATYTSCFRVYRRETLARLDITEMGFVGITEIFARLDLLGHKIVEYPAELGVRRYGQSKMKVARVIIGHLRLWNKFLALRILNNLQTTTRTLWQRI